MWKIVKIGVALFVVLAAALTGLVIGYKEGIHGRFNPDLYGIAMLLSETPSAEANPLALSVDVIESEGKPELRCSLTNISSQTIQIAEHALPCKFNHTFNATGISLTGSSELLFTWPVSMIVPLPEPQVQLLAGQTLTIEGQLKYMFQNDAIPKKSAVLLLWSYRSGRHVNTGITLLPGSGKS